jgi:tetratricopeptide (TPR) repeat protein
MSLRDEFEQAQTFYQQGRFRSVIGQTEELLARHPEHTPYLAYNLGELYQRQVGDGEKAHSCYERGLTGFDFSKGVIQPGMLYQIEANTCENLMLLSLSYDEYDCWASRLEQIQPQNTILSVQRLIVQNMRKHANRWSDVMFWMADSFKPELPDSPYLGGAASIYQLLAIHSKELRLYPKIRRKAILQYGMLAISIAARSDRTMQIARIRPDPHEYRFVLEAALAMVEQVTAADPTDAMAQGVQQQLIQALKLSHSL